MMRRVLLALVAGVVIAVLLEMVTVTPRSIIDFTAFYCAGRVVRDHGDPYRAQPLGACEAKLGSEGIYGVRGVVMPAPLPPYALAPFVALASLPYQRALVVWRLFLIVAVIVTIAALREAARLPWFTVAIALLMIDLVDDVLPGQPVPIVVAAIALGAWALARDADRLAGVVACVTMLEPHIGLPACLSLYLYRPAARPPIICGVPIAAALSVVMVPASTSIEYFTQVLPQHAASEIPWYWQYSLTQALHVFGASDQVSLVAGSLSYLAMLLVALVVTPRAALRLGAPSLLIALPAAATVFGGTFIHLAQVVAAIPAALILAGRAPGTVSRLSGVACVLLTVPGIQFGSSSIAFIAAGVVGVLTALLLRPPPVVAAIVTVSVLAGGLVFHGMHPINVRTGHAPTMSSVSADALAEESWSRFVRAEDSGLREHQLELLAKFPTWAGLGLLCGAAALSTFAGARGKAKPEAALPDPCRG
ncbi:MAG: DUF2029 domain-containing protein [Rhodanobacteraceae bacterium]|nr:MAG: DUF2029 domain-containing protein [Rhodanobacteraceae bacterium]